MANDFYTEPTMECPICGRTINAEWVDIGFGPYSCQAEPFYCRDCDWVESGCPAEECVEGRCVSWNKCKGRAIVEEKCA